jgi:spermidine synthase
VNPSRRFWFFIFFLASGFCGLVAEVVWLRLAMAQFGVVTPLVSTVLSVFMAGLAIGSWQGGRLAARAAAWPRLSPIRLYACAEIAIGLSALVVPALFSVGRMLLLRAGEGAAWGSLRYHLASGGWIAIALLPFCMCMGATFPLALAALRDGSGSSGERPFGHLYAANVLGACCGTFFSAFVLIEIFGFAGTLRIAAAVNVAVALGALLVEATSRTVSAAPERADAVAAPPAAAPVTGRDATLLMAMLFTTGLASMAMEVVWIRQFTPYAGTAVYAFATILTVYLAATFIGARFHRKGTLRAPDILWSVAGVAALVPLGAADPRFFSRLVGPAPVLGGYTLAAVVRVSLGLFPICAAVGYLTPMLIDRFSTGDAVRAGRAYAMNVVGCILGPLLASFVLLPGLGERGSIVALAAPLFAIALITAARWAAPMAAIAGGILLVGVTRDFSTVFQAPRVQRDYEATVIASDARGVKQLLVNGIGITTLTPITKFMVHMPLAYLDAPPANVLVICFGMGTSFRSALSWNVSTTAAELVPSVPKLFGFYHADAAQLLASPQAHVVIDDGRRFLERAGDTFDLITVDPPPPVEAAGSGLLYSREFYTAARRRLRHGGILQQWFPGGEPIIAAAVTRSIVESFPYVRMFPSIEGWGYHYVASDAPIPERSAVDLASRLPPRAAADLTEWFEGITVPQLMERLLAREIKPDRFLASAPQTPALVDDRPINEYFLLRRAFRR